MAVILSPPHCVKKRVKRYVYIKEFLWMWVGINTRGNRHENYFAFHLQQAASATTQVIVHANDTDVSVLGIYYVATLLSGLWELSVRIQHHKYTPVKK